MEIDNSESEIVSSEPQPEHKEIAEKSDSLATEDAPKVTNIVESAAHGIVVQAKDIRGDIYFGNRQEESVSLEIRQLFVNSIRNRDDFMSLFLGQALRQSGLAFNLSVCFMILGGLAVLTAAALAITRFAGSPSHGIALISGVGGVLVGASGAAFSRRADKSRKHLAQQAAMMQSQLMDEQKYSQVIDLLSGIRDPQKNDQARMALALRLMGEINENQEVRLNEAAKASEDKPTETNDGRRVKRKRAR